MPGVNCTLHYCLLLQSLLASQDILEGIVVTGAGNFVSSLEIITAGQFPPVSAKLFAAGQSSPALLPKLLSQLAASQVLFVMSCHRMTWACKHMMVCNLVNLPLNHPENTL